MKESEEAALCCDAQELVRVGIWVARMVRDVVESISTDSQTLFPAHGEDSALANACRDGLTGISLAKRVIHELQSRGHRFESLLELDEATLSLRESWAFFQDSQLPPEVRSATNRTIDAVDYAQFTSDPGNRQPPDSWFEEDSKTLRGL